MPPPTPSNKVDSAPIDNTNMRPIPPANNPNTEILADSNEQVPPSKSFLSNLREGVSKVGDKFKNSFKSKDPNEPNQTTNKPTFLGKAAGFLAKNTVGRQLKQIGFNDEFVNQASNAAGKGFNNMGIRDLAKGAYIAKQISNRDFENINADTSAGLMKKYGEGVLTPRTGGKKRKSKKRINKNKRKTNKKRSKK